MTKLFSGLVASTLALSVLSVSAFAAAPAKPMKAAATLKCPACGMPMPMKKSAAYPAPKVINGKTYYCCAKCPIGKKIMAAMHTKKPGVKKHAM